MIFGSQRSFPCSQEPGPGIPLLSFESAGHHGRDEDCSIDKMRPGYSASSVRQHQKKFHYSRNRVKKNETETQRKPGRRAAFNSCKNERKLEKVFHQNVWSNLLLNARRSPRSCFTLSLPAFFNLPQNVLRFFTFFRTWNIDRASFSHNFDVTVNLTLTTI